MYSKLKMTVVATAVGALLVPAIAATNVQQHDQVSSVDSRQSQSYQGGTHAGTQGASANANVIDAQGPNYSQSMQHLLASAQKLRESIQHLAQIPAGDQRDAAIREAHQALFDTHQAMINLPPQYRSELGQRVAGGAQSGTSQQQDVAGAQQGASAAVQTEQAQRAGDQSGNQQSGTASSSFDKLDRDQDGFLSMTELAADEDSKQIFQRLDRDADDRLSRSEWGPDTAAIVVSAYTTSQPAGSTPGVQGAQQEDPQQNERSQWNVSQLYDSSWSARELIGTTVLGDSGKQIGEVKDIVVNEQGQINKVIVEVGGFLEIADQHIGVPWEKVNLSSGMRWVQVPLREVEDGTFSLFGAVPQGEDVAIASSAWRVNELIGDVVSLQDVGRNGLVMDVIFNEQGKALGVVVDRGVHQNVGGWYAYPYGGYYPGSYGYPLPFQGYETAAAGAFSYEELAQRSPYATDRSDLAQRQSMSTLRSGTDSQQAAGMSQGSDFMSLDRNGDGFISQAEFASGEKQFQQGLGSSQASQASS